jgi:hypothetical protein
VLCRAAAVDPVALDCRVGDWKSLGRSQKHCHKRRAKKLIRVVCEIIAPGQSEDLMAEIEKEPPPDNPSEDLPLLDNVIQLYSTSPSWQEKRKYLSLFCGLFSKERLMNLVPGLTVYAINAARRHSSIEGIGADVPVSQITRYRLSEAKVDHFLDFITDPVFFKTSSYGSQEVTLSTGDILDMPNIVRPIMANHLIDCYLAYCDEVDFEPLSKSSLFRILNDCPATYGKNFQGLDNVSAQGMEGFNLLEDMCKRLQLFGETIEWMKKVSNKISAFKDYLKVGYRNHISICSDCPFHCIMYSLSDSCNSSFAVKCAHVHNKDCNECLLLGNISQDLSEAISKLKDDVMKTEMEHELATAMSYVEEYRSHIMRCVNQDR